ncbi:MAG: bacteriohemerythrin [Rhodospirillaceae bacterium]
MSLIEWTEQMSIGISRFDEEHKYLISLMNTLFDGVSTGEGRQVLGTVLDGLVEYTKTHFLNEEILLKEYGYEGLDSHHAEHKELTRKVLDIQQRYHAGATTMLSLEVMGFLKNWLVKHIQTSDRRYGDFLRTRGMI